MEEDSKKKISRNYSESQMKVVTDIAVMKEQMLGLRRSFDEVRDEIKKLQNYFCTKEELKTLSDKTSTDILNIRNEISPYTDGVRKMIWIMVVIIFTALLSLVVAVGKK